jgi:hypothetical protein
MWGDLSSPPRPGDDGDWQDAYTGEHEVNEFYDRDDVLWSDILVEIDDGNLHSVLSVDGNKDKALCEKVLGLMEERGWEYDG